MVQVSALLGQLMDNDVHIYLFCSPLTRLTTYILDYILIIISHARRTDQYWREYNFDIRKKNTLRISLILKEIKWLVSIGNS